MTKYKFSIDSVQLLNLHQCSPVMFMAFTCLYAVPTSSNAPEVTVDDALQHPLLDLDQGLTKLLNSLWHYLAVLQGYITFQRF